MLKFYVSVRPIQLGKELLEPYDQLKYGFKGLDISHKLFSCDRSKDGRYLLEIVIGKNSQYSNQDCLDYKAIILEGLQAWSCHEKSAQSACDLAHDLSGATWEVADDNVSIQLA